MTRRRLRVYADTSVFGGCFDERFATDSKRFFEEARAGRFALVISGVLLREMGSAPEKVQDVLESVPSECVDDLADSEEIEALRDAYVDAAVVGSGSKADAEHVAAASVANVDMLVSWNFRHIVHFDRIRGYCGVNLLKGYGPLEIRSPKEVVAE